MTVLSQNRLKQAGGTPLHGPVGMTSVIFWRKIILYLADNVNANVLYSVGGGSVIDTAKAANLSV